MNIVNVSNWDEFVEVAETQGIDVVFSPNLVIDCNNTEISIGFDVLCDSVDFNGCIIRNLNIPSSELNGEQYCFLRSRLCNVYDNTIKNLTLENCTVGTRSIVIDIVHGYGFGERNLFIENVKMNFIGSYFKVINTAYDISKSAFSFHFLDHSDIQENYYLFNCAYGRGSFTDTVFSFLNNYGPAPVGVNLFDVYNDIHMDYCYLETVNGAYPFSALTFTGENNFFNCTVNSDVVINIGFDSGVLLANDSKIINDGSVTCTNPLMHKLTDSQLKDYTLVLATGFDIWPKLAE